jgi:hypothetical protein
MRSGAVGLLGMTLGAWVVENADASWSNGAKARAGAIVVLIIYHAIFGRRTA